MLSHYQEQKVGREGLCAIKLDMHKAYDRVEWPFLKEIMLKLGFRQEWVNLIMQCVSTVEYRVRINAEESESFKLTRGLRQGLFLLCTEGLNALLTHAEENGNISGVKVCRDASPVTNLLFADDSLILMKANQHNAVALKSAKLKDDGSNYTDWVCNLMIILIAAQKNYVLEAPPGARPAADATADVVNVWQRKADDYSIV